MSKLLLPVAVLFFFVLFQCTAALKPDNVELDSVIKPKDSHDKPGTKVASKEEDAKPKNDKAKKPAEIAAKKEGDEKKKAPESSGKKTTAVPTGKDKKPADSTSKKADAAASAKDKKPSEPAPKKGAAASGKDKDKKPADAPPKKGDAPAAGKGKKPQEPPPKKGSGKKPADAKDKPKDGKADKPKDDKAAKPKGAKEEKPKDSKTEKPKAEPPAKSGGKKDKPATTEAPTIGKARKRPSLETPEVTTKPRKGKATTPSPKVPAGKGNATKAEEKPKLDKAPKVAAPKASDVVVDNPVEVFKDVPTDPNLDLKIFEGKNEEQVASLELGDHEIAALEHKDTIGVYIYRDGKPFKSKYSTIVKTRTGGKIRFHRVEEPLDGSTDGSSHTETWFRIDAPPDVQRKDVLLAVLNKFNKGMFFPYATHKSKSIKWSSALADAFKGADIELRFIDYHGPEALTEEVTLKLIEAVHALNWNDDATPGPYTDAFFHKKAIQGLELLTLPRAQADIKEETLVTHKAYWLEFGKAPKITLKSIRRWMQPVLDGKEDMRKLWIARPSFKIEGANFIPGKKDKQGREIRLQPHQDSDVFEIKVKDPKKEARLRVEGSRLEVYYADLDEEERVTA